MRKRNELVREPRVRLDTSPELTEVCRQVWKIDRTLGLLPEMPTPALSKPAPVKAPVEIAV